MAHIGYFGKVHLRRDLSQNTLTYRLAAYYNRYFAGDAFGTHGGAFGIGPAHYLSNVGIDGVSPMLTYTWPTFMSHGDTWYLECKALQPLTPTFGLQDQVVTWYRNSGVAYQQYYTGQLNPDYVNFHVGRLLSTTDNLPLYVKQTGLGYVIEGQNWDSP